MRRQCSLHPSSRLVRLQKSLVRVRLFFQAIVSYPTPRYDAPRRADNFLVGRGVEQAQVVDDAAGRDQTLTGLPDLVVDDVNPIVAIGRQPAPRVAVEDGGGAFRGGRRRA